ncbi:MAG: hypothetical protein ACTHJT_03715 [Cytophaga sp.]|uniref:hypothetical protein n=1 Tax=Cytophaga sp. TaxID=29535 RepID=UPI003F81C12C
MKYIQSMIVLAAIVFCLGTAVSSCMDSDRKVDDVNENVKAAKEKFEENKQELSQDIADFRLQLNKKYEHNKAELIKFKNDKKRMAEASYRERVEELEVQNERMKIKLDSAQTNAAIEWENFKKDLDHEMNDLEKSVKEFEQKL